MSILTDKLPDSVEIKGQNCPIKTDFRTWIRFTQIITESGTITPSKIAEMFRLIFPSLPPNFFDAIQSIMKFYKGTEIKEGKGETENRINRVFDYEYDADLIYSAFLQQYRIDLVAADLHWHQFKALFNSLSDETQLVKVIQYRSVNLSEIKDKEMKKFYKKMKEAYRLPDNRSEEEKEDDFNNELSRMFEGM